MTIKYGVMLVVVLVGVTVGVHFFSFKRVDVVEQKNALALLCEYLKIDTTTKHADYQSAITLFERQAHVDGFETQRVHLPSGRPALLIIARGTDQHAKAFALHQHMDVVPVGDVALWKHAPFAGTCEYGVVYGRGVQDMKGVGVAQYEGLRLFKQCHGAARRTICLVLVPDEEIGGFTGAGQLVQTPEFRALNVGYVLDEGGASGKDGIFCAVATQRKPLQIVVECCGTSAHASLLLADNPVHQLVGFLERIRELHVDHQRKAQTQPAGLLTSFNITGLSAGDVDGGAMNTIPARARATVDIRIAPDEHVAQVKKMLDDVCREFPGVSYTVRAEVADYEQPHTAENELTTAVATAAKAVNCSIEYVYAEHASDLRFYTQQGIVGLGITPFTAAMQNHEVDESLPVADFERGCTFFYQVLKAMC